MRNKLSMIIALIVLSNFSVMNSTNAYGWYGGYRHDGWHGWYSGGWHDWDDDWYGGELGFGYQTYPYMSGGYYPATTDIYVESDPAPVMVQQQKTAPVWYYCKSPKGYYPYVPACPSGWVIVPATPPH